MIPSMLFYSMLCILFLFIAEPRVLVCATIQVPESWGIGTDNNNYEMKNLVGIYCTHLDHKSEENRLQQLGQVLFNQSMNL